jgi:putative Holliday junction resolvase
MRILALDHGSKRIGVAVSDELGMIAQPLEFIPAEPEGARWGRLQALLVEREVALIVVGMPRNMDGSFGPAADTVRAFMDALRGRVTVPVRAWDERLTTVQAQRAMYEAAVPGRKRRQTVDRTAAAILLQSFLDSGAGAGVLGG